MSKKPAKWRVSALKKIHIGLQWQLYLLQILYSWSRQLDRDIFRTGLRNLSSRSAKKSGLTNDRYVESCRILYLTRLDSSESCNSFDRADMRNNHLQGQWPILNGSLALLTSKKPFKLLYSLISS